MKNTAKSVLVTVLLVCLCVIAAAASAQTQGAEASSKSVWVDEIYDLTNRDKYQLVDHEYSGNGWKGIEGHRYGIETSGSGWNFSYKSSKKSVASVGSDGIITCKKAGIAFITVTDKSDGDTNKFRIRVLKNKKDYSAEYWADYDDEVYPFPGIFTRPKSIYMKGSTLYVEMYVINMNDRPFKGDLGTARLYMYRYWGSESNVDIDDYEYIGSYSLKSASIKAYGAKVIKMKVSGMDAKSIYLRNADAYLKGGRIDGDLWASAY